MENCPMMYTMNQLLKPTVSWVSLFGGLNVIVADSMPFARHALALGRCLHVDMQMYKEFVKCVIDGPVLEINEVSRNFETLCIASAEEIRKC
ncbi:hypothetical protein EJB05_53080, partial [Eragrostis curvula]